MEVGACRDECSRCFESILARVQNCGEGQRRVLRGLRLSRTPAAQGLRVKALGRARAGRIDEERADPARGGGPGGFPPAPPAQGNACGAGTKAACTSTAGAAFVWSRGAGKWLRGHHVSADAR